MKISADAEGNLFEDNSEFAKTYLDEFVENAFDLKKEKSNE